MSFYDNANMDVKPVAERVREYYKPEEVVIVMNIDTEPLKYSIQHPKNVIINQPTAVTKELYYDSDPEIVTLEAGQTRLCQAYEADWMIKCLIDKIVLRNRGRALEAGEKTPMEAVNDPATQHKYIKQIFQGKRDFISEYNEQFVEAQSQESSIEKELGLNKELDNDTSETVTRGPGRPKKQVA